MSKGAYLQDQKCAFCGRLVNEGVAMWEDGQPYHEQCCTRKIAKELGVMEKKASRGTLTLVEAKEMAEQKELYTKLRTAPPTADISKFTNPEIPLFKGNTEFSTVNLANRLNAANERKALGDGKDSQKNIKRIKSAQEDKC